MIVLMADNDPFFLATRSRYLEQAGHTVVRANNPQEAEAVLRQVYVHAAVMDIRLTDDDDDADTSGLQLVTHPDFRRIPKLVVTGFGSFSQANQALVPDADGLPGAYGYLQKTDPPETMIHKVEELRQRLHINEGLRVYSDQPSLPGIPQLAGMLFAKAEAQFVEDQPPADYGRELEDLFRCAFYEAEQITLQRLLWRRGARCGLVVLSYAASGHNAQNSAFIVTCGDADAIRAEVELYKGCVPASGQPGAQAAVRTATTVHFGLNAYKAAERDLEASRTLGEYFGDAAKGQFADMLEKVYGGPLASWHMQTRVEAPADLARIVEAVLPCSREAAAAQLQIHLEAIAEQAKGHGLADVQIAGDALRLALPKLKPDVLPNPASCLAGSPLLTPERAIQYGTLLRSLDGDTVLVVPPDRAWITDYACLAPGPLVADYAIMEVAIKFDLTTCTDVLERYELEKDLTEPRQLDAAMQTSSPAELEKSLLAVKRLRKLASGPCGNDALPYYAALFAATTNRLLQTDPKVRYSRPKIAALLHAALSLALICKRMRASEDAGDDGSGLKLLPDKKQVLVGGVAKPLTPNEYKFLHVLALHGGKVCQRADVELTVFGNVSTVSDSARLNVLINRLRAKIEPDPDRPIYLITVRGHGVQLVPQGRKPAPGTENAASESPDSPD